MRPPTACPRGSAPAFISTIKTSGKPVSFNATRIRFALMLAFCGFALVSDARSLSDLGDRSEHGGRASTEVHDIEAHSGAMQRNIGGERSEGVMGRSPAGARLQGEGETGYRSRDWPGLCRRQGTKSRRLRRRREQLSSRSILNPTGSKHMTCCASDGAAPAQCL